MLAFGALSDDRQVEKAKRRPFHRDPDLVTDKPTRRVVLAKIIKTNSKTVVKPYWRRGLKRGCRNERSPVDAFQGSAFAGGRLVDGRLRCEP